jgi:uncharacterized protein YggT (Ycf19 family)
MFVLPLVVYWLLVIMLVVMIVRMIVSLLSLVVPPLADNPFSRMLASITEPIIAPFRAFLPTFNGVDFFSFIFAIIMLQIMMNFVNIFANLR